MTYREKLAGLSFNTGRHKGTRKTTVVPSEDGPGAAGSTTEHWSGRVDATVVPTVTPNPNIRLEQHHE